MFKCSSSCSRLHTFEVAVVIANYKNFVVNPPLRNHEKDACPNLATVPREVAIGEGVGV